MSATQTQTLAHQPDISYHPDFQKYQLRSERIRPPNASNSKLPEGFPQYLTGPLVWEGLDWTDERQWTLVLSQQDREEIDGALKKFKCELKSPA